MKVIANLKYTTHAGPDPHTFMYRDGKFAVTEGFQRVDGAKSQDVSNDKVNVQSRSTTCAYIVPDPSATVLIV